MKRISEVRIFTMDLCKNKKALQSNANHPACRPYKSHNKQVWTCLRGPCVVRSKLKKFEHVEGSLCSGVQVEQVWTCPRFPVQWGPNWASFSMSRVPCAVSSKLNKFEHVQGQGQGSVQGVKAETLYWGLFKQTRIHNWKHKLCHSIGRP